MDVRRTGIPGAREGARVYTGLLLTAICITTGVGLVLRNSSVSLKFPSATLRFNTTSSKCKFEHQYSLTNGIRATVCDSGNLGAHLDIRQFIDSHPTVKGIVMTYNVFKSLDKFWTSIVKDMDRAIYSYNLTLSAQNDGRLLRDITE